MTIKLTHRIVTSLAILCAGALLTACGEDDSRFEESIAAAQVADEQPAPADDGLAIMGKPGTAAVQDNPYAFQPEVHNPDDKLLTFSITGKPKWATFKKRTGRLSGQPGPAAVGMEYSVQISVSDGVRTAKLRRFRIRVVAFGTEQVTLAWQPPTYNEDGTPLIDLAGHRIYWGTIKGEYSDSIDVDNPGLSTYVVDNLAPNTYYFATTAYNSSGMESELSNIAKAKLN